MHWAVPKTEAMLEVQKSPLIKEEGVGKPSAPQEDDEEDSGILLSSCFFEGLSQTVYLFSYHTTTLSPYSVERTLFILKLIDPYFHWTFNLFMIDPIYLCLFLATFC